MILTYDDLHKLLGDGMSEHEDFIIYSREIIDVPNLSILSCYENGSPYWLTPDGEKLDFDLEGLIRECR